MLSRCREVTRACTCTGSIRSWTNLTEVQVCLSIHLWNFFLVLLRLRAAGVELWSRLLHHLCGRTTGFILWLSSQALCGNVRLSSYPLVFDDFANVDGGLGVLSEVPLLLEEEALSALPTDVWTHEHAAHQRGPRGPQSGRDVDAWGDWEATRVWGEARLTGLSGVLRGGVTQWGLSEAVDGDRLVHDEEPADHFPFAGPQQSYTVQDKQHNVRPVQLGAAQ